MRSMLDRALVRILLSDRRLTPTDVKVYLHMANHPIAPAAVHAGALNMHVETCRRSIKKLVRFDWCYFAESPRKRPVVPIPWMPLDVEHLLIQEVQRIREEVAFWGEWLMKAHLDIIVDDLDFRDNARPSWLVAGDGSGRYEIDRWYRRAKVAIEFHGMHHYPNGGTGWSEGAEHNVQVMRDNLKAGICMRHGIAYVEIAASNLSYGTIVEKLNGLLPLIPVRTDRPLFKHLEALCDSYVNSVARGQIRGRKT